MDEFGMGSAGMNSIYGPTKNLYRSGVPYSIDGLEQRSVNWIFLLIVCL